MSNQFSDELKSDNQNILEDVEESDNNVRECVFFLYLKFPNFQYFFIKHKISLFKLSVMESAF